MIDMLLTKILGSMVDHLFALAAQESPHVDVYLEYGLVVFENHAGETLHDVLVSSVANEDFDFDIDRLNPEVDAKAMERAFAYLSYNGGHPHAYPASGKEIEDSGFRIKISKVPIGVTRYRPPRNETRKDELAVLEVIFKDSHGHYWMKRSGSKAKPLRRRTMSKLMRAGIPESYSERIPN